VIAEENLRFALLNNERVTAAPNLQGLCPGCAQPVIAKCGTQRIWHWAHRTQRTCDQWWEPETEWHRNWKNRFPLDWQEVIQHDPRSGEKHIADVRTSQNLVLEFQYSPLKPEERAARESFYGNMAWVVNGTRLSTVYERFRKGKFVPMTRINPIAKGWYLVDNPEECFPRAWVDSSALVFFDFRETTPTDLPDGVRELLWCLLPKRAGRYAVVTAMARDTFLQEALSLPRLYEGHEAVIQDVTEFLRRRNAQANSQIPAWNAARRRPSRRF
jgi:competence protein CoiA